MTFQMAGYQLVHHGEGRWNGVAIAVRDGIAIDEPITNFGDGPVRNSGAGATVSLEEEDFNPSDEARMLSIRVTPPGADPIRVVSLYAPNGRVVGSRVLRGQAALVRAGPALAGGGARPGRGTGRRRRPQRRPGRHRRLGCARGPRRNPRLRGRARRLSRAPRLGPARRLPRSPSRRSRPVHLVGLPSRQLPQELRHAHRPPAADWRRSPIGSSRSRSIGRRARASRFRRTTRRSCSTSMRPAAPFDPGWDDAEARIVARGGIRPR